MKQEERMAKTGYAQARFERTRQLDIDNAIAAEKRGRVDLPLLLLVLILLTIGVIMVLSASFASAYYELGDPTRYFTRQLSFAVGGVAVMMLVSNVSMKIFRKYSMLLLAGSIALLVLVLFFGVTRNYARRWFEIGPISIQPSEIAKLGVIMSFAVMICKNGEDLRHFKKGSRIKFLKAFAPYVMILGMIAVLLRLEPHNSAIIIIVAIAAVVLFAGGLDMRLCLLAIAIAVVAIVGVVYYAEKSFATINETGVGSYEMGRIVYWLHPDADPTDGGYQVLQSLYAIGSGGLTGLGLGQSRQKYLYLPEEHNDYIFAIVCEELGFVGAALILVLFAILIMRGFWIAMHARTKYDALLAAGITGMLAIQTFLNISVVTNFLPCTGISLPFFSYGGSALAIQLAEMGILLSISRDIPATKAG